MRNLALRSRSRTRDEAPGKGAVAVITGASAGVGRAVAHRLAREGMSLGLLARDPSALEDVRSEVEALGGRAVCEPVDVADDAAVFAAAEAVEAALGPIEVWVNDAMVTVFSPVAEITPEEFRRVTEVTYLGSVHGAMAALKCMRPRDRGVIVQVGSALAYRGIPLQAAYCGAKHAVRGFVDSLRTELRHDRSAIRVCSVHLPAVNTPQFDWARTRTSHQPRPMGKVFQPEAAADAVWRAISEPRREVWVGSPTMIAILGNALAPVIADRRLAATGYAGQQTDAPVKPDRADNLEAPVSSLHRTHGSFDGEARPRALTVDGPVARATVAAVGAGLILGVGFVLARRGVARSSCGASTGCPRWRRDHHVGDAGGRQR